MSKFSEKCKIIIKDNGTNVYRLSQEYKLERTALQRMVTGKRLPSLDFLKRFCKALRIPHKDQQELMQLYEIEQVGKNTYRTRSYIREMLENLSLALQKDVPEESMSYLKLNNISLEKLPQIAKTEVETKMLLLTLINNECSCPGEKHFYTNLAASNHILFEGLSIFSTHAKKDVRIDHLINFQINSNDSIENLKSLRSLVPIIFSDRFDYRTHYCYSKVSPDDLPQMMFPWYIITSHFLLLLAHDGHSAVLHTDPVIIRLYQKEFESAIAQALPLMSTLSDPETALKMYDDGFQDGVRTASIEPQPCIHWLLNPELFQQFASLLTDERLIQLSSSVMAGWDAKLNPTAAMYYSKSGLEYFCKTGKMQGNIGVFLPPLSVEMRKQILDAYLKMTEAQDLPHYLLRENVPLLKDMILEIYGQERVQLIRIDADFRFLFVTVEESSICSSFYDFTESMQDSDMIYSKEETREILQQMIDAL